MYSKHVLLAFAFLTLTVVVQAKGLSFGKKANGTAAAPALSKGFNFGKKKANGLEQMKECCPTMPMLVRETSVKDCAASAKAAKGGKALLSSFGKAGKDNSCLMECAFKTDGFISTAADNKTSVNLAALNAALIKLAKGDWVNITAAQKECTAAAPVADPASSCSSGAGKIVKCLSKYLISMCSALTSTTADCKAKLSAMATDSGDKKGAFSMFAFKFGTKANATKTKT